MLRRIAVYRSEDSAGLPLRHGNSSLAQLLASPLGTSHVHAQAPGVALFWRRHLQLNASACLAASTADAERTWGSLVGTAAGKAAADGSSSGGGGSGSGKAVLTPARPCLHLDALASPPSVRRGQDAMAALMASSGTVIAPQGGSSSGGDGKPPPAPPAASSSRESRAARQLARDVKSGRVGLVSWLLNSRNADERGFRLRYAAARVLGLLLLPARIAWDAATLALHVAAAAAEFAAEAAVALQTHMPAGQSSGVGGAEEGGMLFTAPTASTCANQASSGFAGLQGLLGSSASGCSVADPTSSRRPTVADLVSAVAEAWWTCACEQAAAMAAAAKATAGAAWSAAARMASQARSVVVGRSAESGWRARAWRRSEQLLSQLPTVLANLPGNIAADVVDPLLASLRRSSLPWMAAAAWETGPWLAGLVFPPSQRRYQRPEIVALQRVAALLEAMVAQADAMAEAAAGLAHRALLQPPLKHWHIKEVPVAAQADVNAGNAADAGTNGLSIVFEARGIDLSVWQMPPASALKAALAASQGLGSGNASLGDVWGSSSGNGDGGSVAGLSGGAHADGGRSRQGQERGGAVAMMWPQPYHSDWLAGTGAPAVGARQLAALARSRFAWEALLAACFPLPRLPGYSAPPSAAAAASSGSSGGWVLCPGFGILRRSAPGTAAAATGTTTGSASNASMVVAYEWSGVGDSPLCALHAAPRAAESQQTADVARSAAAAAASVRLLCPESAALDSFGQMQQSSGAAAAPSVDLRSALRFGPQTLCYSHAQSNHTRSLVGLPERVCFPLVCGNTTTVSVAELPLVASAGGLLGQAVLATADAPAALSSAHEPSSASRLRRASVWTINTPAACPVVDAELQEKLHTAMA